jgi:hypothetical protein
MKPFVAPSFTLEAPAEWTDNTTYVLLGPQMGELRISLVLSIARSVAEPRLAEFVDHQYLEIKKLPGFVAQNRESAKIKTFDTIILEFKWKQPAGPLLRQRQWYIWVDGSVYTFTGTATDVEFSKAAPVFAASVHTFTPKKW